MILAAITMTVDPQVLAQQVGELLIAGGTLGDTLNYDEKDYEVLYALGHSCYSQARYKDAVKVFGYLVMHNHLEKRFANAFASSLHMTKSYEEAIKYYSLASVMDMSDPVPTFHTAECMIALGNVPDAREALAIVLKQCVKPEQDALKERANALIALVEGESATAASGGQS